MALTKFMRSRFKTYLRFKPSNDLNFEKEFLEKYPTAMDEMDEYFVEKFPDEIADDKEEDFHDLWERLGEWMLEQEEDREFDLEYDRENKEE